MTLAHPSAPRNVVIVGGGVAALEAVLALRELGGTRLDLTMIAPEADFTVRALSVAEPFAQGRSDSLALGAFMVEHGGTFIREGVKSVDAVTRTLTCASGLEVSYDVLLLALGAVAKPALPHALTFGAGTDPHAFNGILADLEQGWSGSVAFVLPEGCTWPLPLYELALMTAEQVWGMGQDGTALHLVTTETAPLGIFGAAASDAVAGLLDAAKITVHLGVSARVPRSGRITLRDGEELVVDRIVALPVLHGARLPGVPSDADGFIPVDAYSRVRGLDDVYGAGDGTDGLVKQGGLACQQAEVAAAHIAKTAGADVDVEPFAPVLRGRLLTGRRDRFLRRDGSGLPSQASAEPLWWPPAKVSGRLLSPYLEARALVHLPPGAAAVPAPEDDDAGAIEVCVPLPCSEHYREDVLGLDTLGPLVSARRH